MTASTGPDQELPAGHPSPVTVELADADATRGYGRALAAVLRAGDLVVLTGDLGAGKTTLTQGIGAGLGVRGQVASPTFIIARVHPPLPGVAATSGAAGEASTPGEAGPALVHVDAYRLGSLDEVEALDLDTSLEDSVTVVEWGEGLVESLASDRLELSIHRPRGAALVEADGGDAPEEDPAGGTRTVTVRAVGARWAGIRLPS
ncbi:tRNA (adenosine(37)-N6)-threonylcarbamoyltransferase complex ATPase subunit type 1 TsaE [Cellulomonas sp. WB94]|uniref:tRNA (adenosine(37)-N6)-threonylcarbamoyltransferase complex ATPase subunit type 1 TsaE n=1 Tax=Cellulomonas sp. WB94 TaxID=2173174 RepID=UPI000D57FFDC|nr:tRNA (adenosine(37)-N6)-threonylcarbamoyltransferase complex ATPase subunit type 1 TsaE [Cellulomonas sp. WB94]PVU82370.1 tRNA (adenosine(37)-N6)-threonylcarbamoyltransferase complex ATPase subunit type 1 TsaE [Cellulomonas sp. WB94]